MSAAASGVHPLQTHVYTLRLPAWDYDIERVALKRTHSVLLTVPAGAVIEKLVFPWARAVVVMLRVRGSVGAGTGSDIASIATTAGFSIRQLVNKGTPDHV